jgi:Asp-tRNA(Asn)/Glu-tRNA(Gln) amidotransferase A subunit family amidase
MTTAIFYSDATKLAELIRNREISPVEVMQAHLDRIEAVNPKINAIVSVAQGAPKRPGRRRQRCWRATNSARCTVSPSR